MRCALLALQPSTGLSLTSSRSCSAPSHFIVIIVLLSPPACGNHAHCPPVPLPPPSELRLSTVPSYFYFRFPFPPSSLTSSSRPATSQFLAQRSLWLHFHKHGTLIPNAGQAFIVALRKQRVVLFEEAVFHVQDLELQGGALVGIASARKLVDDCGSQG